MKSSLDDLRSFNALQETAKMGWWSADTNKRTITVSSYLIKLFGLESDTLTFDSFRALLYPNTQNETLKSLRNFVLYPCFFDEIFWLKTVEGYQRVRIRAAQPDPNIPLGISAEGVLQCLANDHTIPDIINVAENNLDQLLCWQKSMTKTLLGFLDESSDNPVIQNLLDLILRNFTAGHVRVFSFNHTNDTFSCMYETVSDDAESMKHVLQDLPIEKGKWLTQLLNRQPVFQDEVDVTPLNYAGYQDTVIPDRIKSSMSVPLIAKDDVWGFIKVDVLDQRREWSYLDKESFVTIANVIGVCFALSRSEDQALANSDFLHKLFLNMPMGYFSLRIQMDDDGTVTNYEYLDVNTKFIEMVGKGREQIVGKLHTEVGPIFVNKLDLQVLARVAFEGEIFETRGQMRYNKRFYNTTIYSPRRGDIVALFTDVTDMLVATESLKKSEAELKKVYTNIPVGIEIYDKDGWMIDVNEQELKIQDVPSRDVLLGLNLFDHPSLPKFAFDLLKEGKDVVFDVNADSMSINRKYYGFDSPDRLKYLTIKCTVLNNSEGEIENYLLIVIDNTEMYETSARLREFESAFNSVAEIAEIGFFRWNPIRNKFFGSEQSYRNLGLTKKGDEDINFEDYTNLIHPEDAVILSDFVKRALVGEENTLNYEFRVQNGSQWKWMRGTCYITEYDPEHGNVQFIGINYNINEQKLNEQRLFEAKAKAEESDRLKSAFLANMSHEIRTPLNAIVGFSAVLVETTNEEEKQEYISIIRQNNDQLLNLISDVLDLSKIEAGSMDISLTESNINELCEQVIVSLALRTPAGVEMRFLYNEGGQDDVIRTDVKRVIQVISNFLSNALKFTRQGHIWLSYKLLNDKIEFSVEDTGIGMDPTRAMTVFERFVKLDDFVPGTGLGLAICKSIVEKLGGSIGVDSQPGVGSRFWFTLPISNK